MYRHHLLSILVVGLAVASLGAWPLPPSGDGKIRGRFGTSDIVVTTTNRLAGAIHSVTWDGKEFIDSADHGRQLQSACSFDCEREGRFWAEAYNPTEAGSRYDGAGKTSTSRLLAYRADGAELTTLIRAAFWLRPGEKSAEYPALNKSRLSGHHIAKRVRIGTGKLPNVLAAEIGFTVPEGERHTFAQFEAWTGYMPAEFGTFHAFNPKTGLLEPLSDGPGEQTKPVVLATKDGRYAMGVYSPDQSPGYGRFRFAAEKVVKWNCVFRTPKGKPISSGLHAFRVFAPLGTLEDVRNALAALHAEHAGK